MKNRPIKAKYNLRLRTEIQDFQPIIGGAVPSKRLFSFNEENTLSGVISHSGDGTLSTDKIYAYHDTSCLKLSVVDGDVATLTYTPETTIDLKALSVTEQEFAKVVRTGKNTNRKDRLFFVLNGMLMRDVENDGGIYLNVKFYSGDAYASNMNALRIYKYERNEKNWQKWQLDLQSPDCTYTNGFTDDMWETISKIEFTFSVDVDTADALHYYLQDAYLALPAYQTYRNAVADSYYPDVHEGFGAVSTNAIFISQKFGNDANDGLTYAAPVATVEAACAAVVPTTEYICFIDSCVYRPINGTAAGITQAMLRDVTFIADYLETPVISARAGLYDQYALGSRVINRNAFWRPETGGTRLTVKKDGTAGYTSIGAAFAAWADADDCIEIQDDGVYDEYLEVDETVVIQAAPGCAPTWRHAADDLILKTTAAGVCVYGIKFQGAGQTTASALELTDTYTLKDCTFTGFDDAKIIVDKCGGNAAIDSNLFVSNGETVTCIEYPSGLAAGVKTVINNRGLMLGSTAGNIFVAIAKPAVTDDTTFKCHSNQVLSALANPLGYFLYVGDAASNSKLVKLAVHMNDTNMLVTVPAVAGIDVEPHFYFNYFHDNAGMVFGDYGTATLDVRANYFKNITSYALATGIGTTATQSVCGNIFYRCGTGFYNGAGGGFIYDYYNVYIECDTAYLSVNLDTTIQNQVFVNCTYGIYAPTGITLTLKDSIRYNSPNGGAGTCTDSTGIIATDPNFKNPFLDDFSWDVLSPMEEVPSIAADSLTAFINPTAYAATFKYMQLEGPITGKMLVSDNVEIALQRCTLTGALIGLDETVCAFTETGVLLDSNGIAARLRLAGVHTNVIAIQNNSSFIIRGASSLVNCTATANAWGPAAPVAGYYTQFGTMTTTILNCIFVKNTAYDYGLNLLAQNSMLYSSYYPIAVTEYDNQLLDPAYLFPAIRRLGYDKDNGAYKESTVTDENIGARNLNVINSDLEGQEYTFISVGTIDDEDLSDEDWSPNFMALENPQNIDHDIVPVAAQPVTRLDGEYFARPSSYPRELTLRWAAPGNAKITAGKQALEDMFKSFWVIGLSFDLDKDGNNKYWGWYKVKKEGALHFEQAGYYHSWQPWGGTTLRLVALENFNIVDYVGC